MLLVENNNFIHPKKRNYTQYCQTHQVEPFQNYLELINLRQKFKLFEENVENNLRIIVNDEKSMVEKEYKSFNQYLGEVYQQNQIIQEQRRQKEKGVDSIFNQITNFNNHISQEQRMNHGKYNQRNYPQYGSMDIEESQNFDRQRQCPEIFNKNSNSQFDENIQNNKEEEEIANSVYEYYKQQKEELMRAVQSRFQKMHIEN